MYSLNSTLSTPTLTFTLPTSTPDRFTIEVPLSNNLKQENYSQLSYRIAKLQEELKIQMQIHQSLLQQLKAYTIMDLTSDHTEPYLAKICPSFTNVKPRPTNSELSPTSESGMMGFVMTGQVVDFRKEVDLETLETDLINPSSDNNNTTTKKRHQASFLVYTPPNKKRRTIEEQNLEKIRECENNARYIDRLQKIPSNQQLENCFDLSKFKACAVKSHRQMPIIPISGIIKLKIDGKLSSQPPILDHQQMAQLLVSNLKLNQKSLKKTKIEKKFSFEELGDLSICSLTLSGQNLSCLLSLKLKNEFKKNLGSLKACAVYDLLLKTQVIMSEAVLLSRINNPLEEILQSEKADWTKFIKARSWYSDPS